MHSAILTNPNIPTLPRDIWHHIFQIRATKMWFNLKVVPELQKIVYNTVQTVKSCNSLQDDAAYSQVIHNHKTVAYRSFSTNFGVHVGGPPSTCLHIRRTWLENRFQTRFKTSWDMWVVDAHTICPDCKCFGSRCACPQASGPGGHNGNPRSGVQCAWTLKSTQLSGQR